MLTTNLASTHILITGGSGLIGRTIVSALLAEKAHVSVLDLPSALPSKEKTSPDEENIRYFPVDISSPSSLNQAFTAAEKTFGPVQSCLALAGKDLSILPTSEGIHDSSPEIFMEVLKTNVFGTYLTVRRWAQGLKSIPPEKRAGLKNLSCVIMGSESGNFGVPTMPAYAAGKSAVQDGLLASLAVDLPKTLGRNVRVNAVAPGPVDTERWREEVKRYGEEWKWRESEATVPLGRTVRPEEVARVVVVLASEELSGGVHGQVWRVDGGKTGGMVWDQGEVVS